MFGAHAEPEYLRRVFEDTQVLRKPITGIVTGYHVVPYILVGPDAERHQRSIEIRGRIRVSPRLIISPRHVGQTYGELFDDPEMMSGPSLQLVHVPDGIVRWSTRLPSNS